MKKIDARQKNLLFWNISNSRQIAAGIKQKLASEEESACGRIHFFFYKNKLNKDNETEIGKKNKNKLRKFKGWKVKKKKKIKITLIQISFLRKLFTKE